MESSLPPMPVLLHNSSPTLLEHGDSVSINARNGVITVLRGEGNLLRFADREKSIVQGKKPLDRKDALSGLQNFAKSQGIPASSVIEGLHSEESGIWHFDIT